MTGKDVLDQVREALATKDGAPRFLAHPARAEALAALDGCIVLTREEAARLEGAMQLLAHGILTVKIAEEWESCRALLTPTEGSQP